MRRALRVIFFLAVLGAAGFYWLTRPDSIDAAELPDHQPDPQAGAMVFAAGGCVACHAAPEAQGDEEGGGAPVLSGGLELNTDFGIFVAPNISSDPEYGIGGWSDSEFVTAMKRGTSPEGRHYYPSFPYTSYTRMADADLLDLHAYLQTLPASQVTNRGHDLAFPYNFRRGLGLWKRLYLDATPVLADTSDPVVTRGRYLVEGAGHCAECHTPRDALGGLRTEVWLSGAPNPEGSGRIPNITPHEDGIGTWSENDIAYYLQSGFTPDFDSAGGAMVEVIESVSKLPDEDRAAIAAYLKAVPPVPGER